MVDSMLEGLVLKTDYPQYALIIDAFIVHHEALNWLELSEETQLSYLKTAIKPLTADAGVLNKMHNIVKNGINTATKGSATC